MKYRFYGDELQLIRYEVTVMREHDGEMCPEVYGVVTVEERDRLLERYPNSEFTEVDNSGYEWLDGMVWTQEQLRNGEFDAAVEMGEAAYTELKNAPTTDDYLIDLDYRMSKLELGI